MATQDYNVAKVGYKSKFAGQNRSGTVSDVDAAEQVDRDNLLFFLEDRFKTNGGSVSIEDFRAIIHLLIKSVPNFLDDKNWSVLNAVSGRLSTGAANRWYYGDTAYGWSDETWTTYTSSTVNSTTPPNISGLNSIAAWILPFEVSYFSAKGVIQNDSSTGDVDLMFFYSDSDDPAQTNLQNMTFIGEVTVDCAVEDTGYSFNMNSNLKVPAGKHIFMLIKNTDWTSGTEYIKYNVTFYAQTRTTAFTI